MNVGQRIEDALRFADALAEGNPEHARIRHYAVLAATVRDLTAENQRLESINEAAIRQIANTEQV